MKLLILDGLRDGTPLRTIADSDIVVVLKPEPTVIKDRYGDTKLVRTVNSA